MGKESGVASQPGNSCLLLPVTSLAPPALCWAVAAGGARSRMEALAPGCCINQGSGGPAPKHAGMGMWAQRGTDCDNPGRWAGGLLPGILLPPAGHVPTARWPQDWTGARHKDTHHVGAPGRSSLGTDTMQHTGAWGKLALFNNGR